MTTTAQQFYNDRCTHEGARLAALLRRDHTVSMLRLAVFVLAAALVTAAMQGMGAWLWYPATGVTLIFAALLVHHESVRQTIDLCKRRIAHAETGLRRLAGHWHDDGVTERPQELDDHLFADDLDIFGPGSLFQLICRARTSSGRRRLADWLCRPTDVDSLRARQVAVAQLRGYAQMREDMAILGGDIEARVDAQRVVDWGNGPPLLSLRATRYLRLAAWVLPALVLASLGAWLLELTSGWLILGLLAVESMVVATIKDPLRRVRSELMFRTRDLEVIAALLARIGDESFEAAKLQQIQQDLKVEGLKVEQQVRRLRTRVELTAALSNGIFAFMVFPLMWSTHCLLALEKWRHTVGTRLGDWIDALAEFEALASLACHAYENPEDPFPTLRGPEQPCLQITDAGHPLLDPQSCVRNSIELGEKPQLLLVSGSNMSGKSTYLRSIGINVVLAQAGAPVRARAMTLSPLKIGATVRIEDSLQAGKSRFYAEVSRLKHIVDLARIDDGRALLFLFDELFHGTNSHDRRIGAKRLINIVVAQCALGLVTTHDLELTKIVDELGPRAANVHFCDDIVDGRLHFDYRMKPGVVQSSNALAVLDAAGLGVDNCAP